MPLSPLAGKPAPPELLIDRRPIGRAPTTIAVPIRRTRASRSPSGPAATAARPRTARSTRRTSCAITQAICEHRARAGHHRAALPRRRHARGVGARAEDRARGAGGERRRDAGLAPSGDFTPTPALSRAILAHNRRAQADGGSPTASSSRRRTTRRATAASSTTRPTAARPTPTSPTAIQARANELLRAGASSVKRLPYAAARKAPTTHEYDFLDALRRGSAARRSTSRRSRAPGVKLGADPMGGASVHYWSRIAERFGLDLTVVNTTVDPRFAFMPLDHDGKIRMDCSSPYAMANLLAPQGPLRRRLRQRHRRRSPRHRHARPGLMNPNHYLAVAIGYLFAHRPGWPAGAAVGKTLVSQHPHRSRRRRASAATLREVPVGFKWFVDGPARRQLRLRRRGERRRELPAPRRPRTGPPTRTASSSTCWPPRSPRSPARIRARTTRSCARSSARRTTRASTRPATPAEKAALKKLDPAAVKAATLAGEPIVAKLTRAPGNDAPDRRPQGRERRTAGSRRVRRARRTSTRSTPRA